MTLPSQSVQTGVTFGSAEPEHALDRPPQSKAFCIASIDAASSANLERAGRRIVCVCATPFVLSSDRRRAVISSRRDNGVCVFSWPMSPSAAGLYGPSCSAIVGHLLGVRSPRWQVLIPRRITQLPRWRLGYFGPPFTPEKAGRVLSSENLPVPVTAGVQAQSRTGCLAFRSGDLGRCAGNFQRSRWLRL